MNQADGRESDGGQGALDERLRIVGVDDVDPVLDQEPADLSEQRQMPLPGIAIRDVHGHTPGLDVFDEISPVPKAEHERLKPFPVQVRGKGRHHPFQASPSQELGQLKDPQATAGVAHGISRAKRGPTRLVTARGIRVQIRLAKRSIDRSAAS
jgi:hypothetical protein